jgi:hypothetical protein
MQSTTSTTATASSASSDAGATGAAPAVSVPYVSTYISPYSKVVSPHLGLLTAYANQSFLILEEKHLRLACETHDYTIIRRLQDDPRASLLVARDTSIQSRVMDCLYNDPTATPYDVFNAFYTACEHGDMEIVGKLIQDKRLDPSSLFNKSLKSACENGLVEVVDCLLKDSRVNPADSSNAVLHLALKNGRTAVVERLLKEERVDAKIAEKEYEEVKYKFHYNSAWLMARLRQILEAIPEVTANAMKARNDLEAKVAEKYPDPTDTTPITPEHQILIDKMSNIINTEEIKEIERLEKEAVETEAAIENMPAIIEMYEQKLAAYNSAFPSTAATVSYGVGGGSASSAFSEYALAADAAAAYAASSASAASASVAAC